MKKVIEKKIKKLSRKVWDLKKQEFFKTF